MYETANSRAAVFIKPLCRTFQCFLAIVAAQRISRAWIRLHEKGGKEHIASCVAKLEVYLDEYLAAFSIARQNSLPFFRTTGRKSAAFHRLTQQDAFSMIQRRVKQGGIATHIGNHSLRATGITAYLKHDGTLEYTQQMANHASPHTTKLYDRRIDEATLDECEKKN